MTDKAEVQRTLFILGFNSFLLCYVIFPLIWDAGFLAHLVFPFLRGASGLLTVLILGTVYSVPSIVYWFVARGMMNKLGAAPWVVHAVYILLVLPLTGYWAHGWAGSLK